MTTVIGLNMEQFWFDKSEMSPGDVDGMAKSVEPDQTAPLGAV